MRQQRNLNAFLSFSGIVYIICMEGAGVMKTLIDSLSEMYTTTCLCLLTVILVCCPAMLRSDQPTWVRGLLHVQTHLLLLARFREVGSIHHFLFDDAITRSSRYVPAYKGFLPQSKIHYSLVDILTSTMGGMMRPLLLIAFIATTQTAYCCSEFLLNATFGAGCLSGRTLDFEVDLHSEIGYMPKGTNLTLLPICQGTPAPTLETTYAFAFLASARNIFQSIHKVSGLVTCCKCTTCPVRNIAIVPEHHHSS